MKAVKITSLLSIVILMLAPFIDRNGILELNEQGQYILENLRLPRVYLAFIVGGALAVIGNVTQVVFRNPLATPYTLGFSSLAALALAISELSGSVNSLLIYISISSIFFFLLVLLYIKKISTHKVLLLGVCLSIFSSSAIVFIQSLLGNESVARLIRWMMGSLNIVGYESLLYFLPIYLVGLFLLFRQRSKLTLISIGEDFAQTRGVNVSKVNAQVVLICNLLVAVIVWQCGPIGFVGLIIPHVIRRLSSDNISKNLLFSFIIGGGFLVLCDLLSRSILENSIVPIGAISACIGAPVLVLQLFKKA